MNICISGDVHGRIDKFYENISDFESQLKIKFDVVLQVGDFGIWIDEDRHDGLTKFYHKTGDFPLWYKEKKVAPINTYFINGNNEDFGFLNSVKLSGDFQILKNIHYMPNGSINLIRSSIMAEEDYITVAVMGGRYSQEFFNFKESDRHYTKTEIDTLIKNVNLLPEKMVDIFISHDAPEGVLIEDNDKNKYYPKAVGLRELIVKIKPRISFFGHHHGVCQSEIDGIPVYGLNIIGEKGNMAAIKMLGHDGGRVDFLGTY